MKRIKINYVNPIKWLNFESSWILSKLNYFQVHLIFNIVTWLMCIPWVLSEGSWLKRSQYSHEAACLAPSSTSQRVDWKGKKQEILHSLETDLSGETTGTEEHVCTRFLSHPLCNKSYQACLLNQPPSSINEKDISKCKMLFSSLLSSTLPYLHQHLPF